MTVYLVFGQCIYRVSIPGERKQLLSVASWGLGVQVMAEPWALLGTTTRIRIPVPYKASAKQVHDCMYALEDFVPNIRRKLVVHLFFPIWVHCIRWVLCMS